MNIATTAIDSPKLKEVIRQSWAAELQRDDIGIGDNFFEMGGNSLSAISMLVNLSWKLGCKFEFGAFFEDATIEGLYRIIQDAARDSP